MVISLINYQSLLIIVLTKFFFKHNLQNLFMQRARFLRVQEVALQLTSATSVCPGRV